MRSTISNHIELWKILRQQGKVGAYLWFLFGRHRKFLAFLAVALAGAYSFWGIEQTQNRTAKERAERVAAQQQTNETICRGQISTLTNDLDTVIFLKGLLVQSADERNRSPERPPLTDRQKALLKVALNRADRIADRAVAQLTDLGAIVGEGYSNTLFVMEANACEFTALR